MQVSQLENSILGRRLILHLAKKARVFRISVQLKILSIAILPEFLYISLRTVCFWSRARLVLTIGGVHDRYVSIDA